VLVRECRHERSVDTTARRRYARLMDDGSTRVELMAIPIVGVIFGVGALVLFAATEGPWAWILLGVGLLILLALVVRRMTKKHPHMWDEAPPEETVAGRQDETA
jgi:hypothetical protein